MIYTFYNPYYSGGQFKDFVAFECDSIDKAIYEISGFNTNKCRYSLWSITKGISLSSFIIPTK